MKTHSGLYEGIITYRVRHVKYLLSHGIPINQVNDAGRGVLYAALTIPEPEKRKKMFNFLLRHGADYMVVDREAARDVLQWACHLDRLDQVNKLIDFTPGGLDFRRKDLQGMTALHLAVGRGSEDVVWTLCREMCRLAVTVDITDREGLTPYLRAQREGRGRVASILAEVGGASVQQFDTMSFRTSLEWSEYGRQERQRVAHARTEELLKMNGRGPKLVDLRAGKLSIGNDGLEGAIRRKGLHKGGAGGPRKLPPIQIQVTLPEVAEDVPQKCVDSSVANIPTCDKSSPRLAPLREAPPPATLSPRPEPPGPSRDARRPQAEEMSDILEILATQMCPAFRKPCVPGPSRPYLGPKRVSTLAIIMGQTRARQTRLQSAVITMMKGKGRERKSAGKDPLTNTIALLTKGKQGSRGRMSADKPASRLSVPSVGGD